VGGAVGLAGRVDELRAVSELLSGTSKAAAMLVVGEAGIGKSRLVAAAAADAAQGREVLVLSGWCLRLSDGLPFLPVAGLLRDLAGVDEGGLVKAALADCPPFVAAEVLRLMPDLPQTEEALGAHESDDGWLKQRLFEALRRLFAGLSPLCRIAVVIEDVHWADVTTLEFLDYLLAPSHAVDVPVVITCRSEETPSAPLVELLERLHRNPRVHRLDLAPMSDAETAEQIELLLGRRPSPELAAGIYARSDGNAFFTEQLIAAGDLAGVAEALPAGLTSLLLSRTAQVGGAGKEVLSALAVAARPLDEASLVQLCGRPSGEVREALRDLLARRLLRRPDHTGRHHLRHALLAQAVAGELLPSERQELHLRTADLMADWNDPGVAAQIAEHYAASVRPADELRWRVLAGRQADAVYASTEAAMHWQRAVALCTQAPLTQQVEGISLAAIYGAAEDALGLSGNDQAAHALAEDAVRQLADADPASRADALRRAGKFHGVSQWQSALALLGQALALYEQLGDSAGQVKALREMARILHNEGQRTDAEALFDQGAAIAEHAGLRTALFEFRCVQAMYQSAAGDSELALERIHALRETLIESDGPGAYLLLAMFHATILFDLGRLADVEAAGAQALQMAAECGMDQYFRAALVRHNVFEALTEIGIIDRAARLIEPVSLGAVDITSRLDHAARATVEMLRGELDLARRHWAEIDALPAPPLAFRVDAGLRETELHLWRRAPRPAYEQSHALLAQTAGAAPPDWSSSLLILAIRACADSAEQARADRNSDDLAGAGAQADQLTALHQQMAEDPFTPGPRRWTAYADGLLWHAEWSRLRGEPDNVLWAQAASAWDALSRPHRAAYARWRQAETLLAKPDGRAAAATPLRTAASQAQQHVPLATAIEDLARRARIDLSQSNRPA
jgi:predicted ATPase